MLRVCQDVHNRAAGSAEMSQSSTRDTKDHVCSKYPTQVENHSHVVMTILSHRMKLQIHIERYIRISRAVLRPLMPDIGSFTKLRASTRLQHSGLAMAT